MRFLDLELIKRQIVMDEWYHEEDSFLEYIGDSAEEYVEQLVNEDLNTIEARYGKMPMPLMSAMLIYCDYLYSQERGSSNGEKALPVAIEHFIKLYRNFT